MNYQEEKTGLLEYLNLRPDKNKVILYYGHRKPQSTNDLIREIENDTDQGRIMVNLSAKVKVRQRTHRDDFITKVLLFLKRVVFKD